MSATIHSLFEDRAKDIPEHIAVIYKDYSMTYSELAKRINYIAWQLLSKNINKQTIIGVHIDSGIDLICSILGILKAGFAFMPLDPQYPINKLKSFISNSNIAYVITEKNSQKLLSFDNVTFFTVEGLLNDSLVEQTIPQVKSSDLAYVIYTSGSTNTPKGVLGTHAGIISRMQWMWKEYPFLPGEITCQKTSIGFIDSLFELFGGLCQGVTTVYLDKREIKDPISLANNIETYGITRLVTVPTLLNILLHYSLSSRLDSLTYCFVSGEDLSVNIAKKFLMTYPSTRLINLYGSTEVAADITHHEIRLSDLNKSRIPIGKVIDNHLVYLVDSALSQVLPLPFQIGEITFSGPQLALGYHNNEILTSERFIPNPFLLGNEFFSEQNSMLFRTGDLGYYDEEQNLIYCGRIDDQIKFNGIRIDPKEIEDNIIKYDSINYAVVLLNEDEERKELIAYLHFKKLLTQSEKQKNVTKLYNIMKEHLSASMIPNAYVVLDVFPKTLSGKIDRKKLAEYKTYYRPFDLAFKPPATQQEIILASLWSNLLKINKQLIGINDNFFSLGGNSLLATQLAFQIKSIMQINLSLQNIFDYPVLNAMAKKIHASPSAIEHSLNKDRALFLPLSMAQQRMYIIQHSLSKKEIYHISLVFNLYGHVRADALNQALQHVLSRHEILRTGFQLSNDDISMQVIRPVNPKFSILTEQVIDEKNMDLEIEGILSKPFDLAYESLLRCVLLKIMRPMQHEDSYYFKFLIVVHHLVFDGESINLLINEISNLYNHYAHRSVLNLPELTAQYADYVLWEKDYLTSETMRSQANYWQTKLADIPIQQRFLTEQPNTQPGIHTATYELFFDDGLMLEIKQLTEQHRITIFMVLLTVLFILIKKYNNQTKLAIATPALNRIRPEFINLIGLFANFNILALELQPQSSYSDILIQVKNLLLEALHHQEVPYTQICELHPCFQNNRPTAILTYENKVPTLDFNEILTQFVRMDNPYGQHELIISAIEEENQRFYCKFIYRTDLYSRETIEQFALHFRDILTNLVVVTLTAST